MDANKRDELVRIGYSIPATCNFCEHGQFQSPGTDWGTCAVNVYTHLKHTGPARQLSIFRAGACPKFKADEGKLVVLGKFREFLR